MENEEINPKLLIELSIYLDERTYPIDPDLKDRENTQRRIKSEMRTCILAHLYNNESGLSQRKETCEYYELTRYSHGRKLLAKLKTDLSRIQEEFSPAITYADLRYGNLEKTLDNLLE